MPGIAGVGFNPLAASCPAARPIPAASWIIDHRHPPARINHPILVAAEHDKGKLSKDAEKDIKAIKETVERSEEKEAKRVKLLLEAERLTLELQEDYKTLTKHSSNMGRHADNAHGAGTPEAGAHRKDD